MKQINIDAQLHKNKITTSEIIDQQKKLIQEFVDSTHGNEKERKELEDSLNLQKKLVFSAGPLKPKEKALKQFLKDLETSLDVSITAGLGVSANDKNKSRTVISNEAYEAFQKQWKEEQKQFNSNKNNLTYSEFKQKLEKLKIAYNNAKTDDMASLEAKKELKNILDSLKRYEDQSHWKKYGRGYSLPWDATHKGSYNRLTGQQIMEQLNKGAELVTLGSVGQKIGIIGEKFGAAAIAASLAKTDEEAEKLLDQLFKNNKGTTGSITVKITGEEKSGKGYSDTSASDFVKKQSMIKISEDGEEDEFFYHLHQTDDKVDFFVKTKDKEYPLNFSMKNYSSPSSVTILKGNIYPILAIYNQFIKHYIGLLCSQEEDEPNSLNKMYQTAKFTVGVHALIGGVRAVTNDGNVISTASADYFIVNDNTKTENGISVYSTKQLGKAIIDRCDLITLKGGDEKTINKRYKPGKYDNRFANISVELHLSQLKKTISKNLTR